MSLTIQQIITEAQRLAGRLKERDHVADVLLNETNAITKKIDAMKQFQVDVDQLNDVAHQKPHTQLIANIQKENRHLREIQQENRELRAALEDYQTTLEHVMTKYREHTTDAVYRTRVDFGGVQHCQYDEIIRGQAEKIAEMAAVMKRAAAIDDGRVFYNEGLVGMLKQENRGLKEMLRISYRYGSINEGCTTEDKDVQTETST